MTVIVAELDEKEGVVYMAADRASTDDDSAYMTQHRLRYPKMVKVGEALIGMAGQHFYHSLMRFHNPPPLRASSTTHEWYHIKFEPWITAEIEKIAPSKKTGNFLLARGDELYLIDLKQGDLVPVESYAIGHGEQYAFGALAVLQHVSVMPTKQRVAAACEAACLHDPYCGHGIDVFSTAP